MSFLKSLQGVPCRRKKAPRDRGDCGDVTEKRPIWTQRPHFFLFLHHSGFISAHHRASLTETKEDGCINHRACLGQKSPRQRQHADRKVFQPDHEGRDRPGERQRVGAWPPPHGRVQISAQRGPCDAGLRYPSCEGAQGPGHTPSVS